MKKFRALTLLVLGLALTPLTLLADNVLVFGPGYGTSKADLTTALEALGHTVSNQGPLPADLSTFDTIWHLSALTALTADEQTRLASFVAAGGGVHLTGENPCCEGLNTSVQAVVNAVVNGGGIQVGSQGLIGGPYAINPSAQGGIATTPNAITTWVPAAPGGIGGLGALPAPNILVSGAGDAPVGGVWGEADMVSGSGRMTVLMDVNWIETAYSGGDNLALVENMQFFLGSGEAGEVEPTARFKVTKTFTDSITDEVEVTLTCNGGLPLQQSFTIAGGGDGVMFTVTNIPAAGVDCEVTENGGLDNYTPSFNAGVGCAWSNINYGVYICEIVNTPNPAEYTVTNEWVIGEHGSEPDSLDVDITVTCTADILTVNGVVVSPSTVYNGSLGDGELVTFGVDTMTGAAQCSAVQDVSVSGVESVASADCTNADLQAAGSASCSFTNTLFFEGIPTLSQYGLAILALLMLGVGFIGMRRFV